MKKVTIIALSVLFVIVFVFLQYNLVALGHNAFSSPNNGVIGAAFDVFLGSLLCIIAKLSSEKRANARKVIRFLGLWTIGGGILLFLISIIRILFER